MSLRTEGAGATHVPDVDLVARRQHTGSRSDRHASKRSRSTRDAESRCSGEPIRAGTECTSTKSSRAGAAVSASPAEPAAKASASGSAAEPAATATSCRRETVLADFKHRSLELEAVVHG
jgi:hypothetical protein